MKIYQHKNKEEDKVLRKISDDIAFSDITSKEIKKIIDGMKNFLTLQPDGVALAAPQVGKNKRLIVLSQKVFDSVGRKVDENDLVFINPKIIKHSKKKIISEEGCFSVRWYYGNVERYAKVTVEAYNKVGEKKQWSSGGFLSQVLQHEIDHLDGILFIDKTDDIWKMSKEEIEEIKTLQKKLKKQKKV